MRRNSKGVVTHFQESSSTSRNVNLHPEPKSVADRCHGANRASFEIFQSLGSTIRRHRTYSSGRLQIASSSVSVWQERIPLNG